MDVGSNPPNSVSLAEGDLHLLPPEYRLKHHLLETTALRRRQAAIYARFSSEGQNESSIERQLEMAHAFALSMGLDVVKVYIDRGVSGTILNRPALLQMRKDIADGIITDVIVELPCRLARKESVAHNIYDFLTVSRVRLFSVQSGELDPLSFALAALMGAEYRRNFARLSADGKIRAARQGRFMGRGPFGTMPGSTRRGVRVLHPERARSCLKSLFDTSPGEPRVDRRAISGRCYTPSSCVVLDMVAAGRKRRSGKPMPPLTKEWDGQMVRNVILNPAILAS